MGMIEGKPQAAVPLALADHWDHVGKTGRRPLLHLDGLDLMPLPLADRKARLAVLLEQTDAAIRYSDHQIGLGPAFHRHACPLGLEGIVSKRLNAA